MATPLRGYRSSTVQDIRDARARRNVSAAAVHRRIIFRIVHEDVRLLLLLPLCEPTDSHVLKTSMPSVTDPKTT